MGTRHKPEAPCQGKPQNVGVLQPKRLLVTLGSYHRIFVEIDFEWLALICNELFMSFHCRHNVVIKYFLLFMKSKAKKASLKNLCKASTFRLFNMIVIIAIKYSASRSFGGITRSELIRIRKKDFLSDFPDMRCPTTFLQKSSNQTNIEATTMNQRVNGYLKKMMNIQ